MSAIPHTTPSNARRPKVQRGCDNDHRLQVPLRIDTGQAQSVAAQFKALGHPIRLQILDILSRYSGQVCVCDLESHFTLKQPTISHHLKVLREAGFIESEQRGLWVYYSVKAEALVALKSPLNTLLTDETQEASSFGD